MTKADKADNDLARSGSATNKLILCLLLALILIPAWFAYEFFTVWSDPEFEPEAFAISKWHQPIDHNHRLRMVDDLLNSTNFVGWSTNKVVSLLGPPDSIGNKEADVRYHPYALVYVLGDDRSSMISLGTSNLGFTITADHRIEKADIIYIH